MAWRRIGYFIIFMAVTIYVAVAWLILSAAKAHEPDAADAIIVLGAAAWGDKPSPVFTERIRHAVKLYQQGYARKIIVTGGTPKLGYPTEAQVAKHWAIKHGVPAEAILSEPASRSTLHNLKNAQALGRSQNLYKFIIVSDPYHMARAKWMAHDLGMQVQLSPTVTSRFNQTATFNKIRFFHREWRDLAAYLLLRTFFSPQRVEAILWREKKQPYKSIPIE